MTNEEAGWILGLIEHAYPGKFRYGMGTASVWAMLLNDMKFGDVTRAVHGWAQRESRPPTIADIRRLVAPSSPDELAGNHVASYSEYLKSEHWLHVRERALKAAKYMCVVCGSSGQLDVHHRSYERLGNEDEDDVTVLCGDCHRTFHGK